MIVTSRLWSLRHFLVFVLFYIRESLFVNKHVLLKLKTKITTLSLGLGTGRVITQAPEQGGVFRGSRSTTPSGS